MADEAFKVTIKGPEMNVTREVEEEVALHILSIAVGNESGLAPSGSTSETEDTANTVPCC